MKYRILAIISLLTVITDQLTKYWIMSTLSPYIQKDIFGEFLRFSLTFNSKGIFGLPIGIGITYYVVPLIGIGLVLFFAIRTSGNLYTAAFGLILGGALGNIIDRIRLGKVIDFIDVGIKEIRWPTFNFADFFIVVGILLLLFRERDKETE